MDKGNKETSQVPLSLVGGGWHVDGKLPGDVIISVMLEQSSWDSGRLWGDCTIHMRGSGKPPGSSACLRRIFGSSMLTSSIEILLKDVFGSLRKYQTEDIWIWFGFLLCRICDTIQSLNYFTWKINVPMLNLPPVLRRLYKVIMEELSAVYIKIL